MAWAGAALVFHFQFWVKSVNNQLGSDGRQLSVFYLFQMILSEVYLPEI